MKEIQDLHPDLDPEESHRMTGEDSGLREHDFLSDATKRKLRRAGIVAGVTLGTAALALGIYELRRRHGSKPPENNFLKTIAKLSSRR